MWVFVRSRSFATIHSFNQNDECTLSSIFAKMELTASSWGPVELLPWPKKLRQPLMPNYRRAHAGESTCLHPIARGCLNFFFIGQVSTFLCSCAHEYVQHCRGSVKFDRPLSSFSRCHKFQDIESLIMLLSTFNLENTNCGIFPLPELLIMIWLT